MNTSTKSTDFFTSAYDSFEHEIESAFLAMIKAGKGAIISHVIAEDIDASFDNLEEDTLYVMIENSDVRQYIHTVESIVKYFALNVPEASVQVVQHGYDAEFIITRNLYK